MSLFTRSLRICFSLFSVCALLLFAQGAYNNLFEFGRNTSFLDWVQGIGLFGALVAFALLYLHFIFNNQENKQIQNIALWTILIVSCARLLWVLTIDAQFVGDFKAYWGCALTTSLGWGDVPRGLGCRGVYLLRTLLYTLPITSIVGNKTWVLELVNVGLIALGSTILYFVLARALSVRIAAIGLLVIHLNPDLWYMATLSSPDVVGFFWLCCLLLCASWIDPCLSKSISRTGNFSLLGKGLSLGVPLFFLYFQGSYFLPACLALASYTLFRPLLESLQHNNLSKTKTNDQLPPFSSFLKAILKNAAVLVVLPFLSFSALESSFWHVATIDKPENSISQLAYFTASDVHRENRYYQMKPWRYDYFPQIPEKSQKDFALRKLIHEFTGDPFEYLSFLARKNTLLTSAIDYHHYARHPAKDPWVGRVNDHMREAQTIAINLLTAVFYLLALLRLFLWPALPFRSLELLIILFSLACYGPILLLAEVTARYDFFLIFCLTIFSATTLDRLKITKKSLLSLRLLKCTATNILSGALTLAILVATYVYAARFIQTHYTPLEDLTIFTTSESPTGKLKFQHVKAGHFAKKNFKQALLAPSRGLDIPPKTLFGMKASFPGQSHSVEKVQFFLTRGYPRASYQPWFDSDFFYVAFLNGKRVKRGSLNSLLVDFVQVRKPNIPAGEPIQLEVYVKNRRPIKRITTSMSRNPLIGVEFVHID